MDTIERKKQSIRKSTVSILFPGFVCLMSYVEGLYWVHHLLHILRPWYLFLILLQRSVTEWLSLSMFARKHQK